MSDPLLPAIRRWAGELGFDHCRVLTAAEAPHWAFFRRWLDRGNAAGMDYLERGAEARRSPAALALPGQPALHTLLVLSVDYRQFELPAAWRDDPARGVVASYAWGEDYHELIRPQLHALDQRIRTATGRQQPGRGFVDAGPVLERDFAEASGLAFTGKNCMSIIPGSGSQCFLATLAIPEVLPTDGGPTSTAASPPMAAVLDGLPARTHLGVHQLPGKRQAATCGQCTRCLVACPTDAFVGPLHLDARRCIAYWTIETQDLAPAALLPGFGNRIFGCDICQEVCPWNHRLAPRPVRLPGLRARDAWMAPPLLEGFQPSSPYWLDDDAFAARFRRSPVKRAKRAGMLRNVCVALGNWGDPQGRAALERAAAEPAPAVQAASAWAMGRLRLA